MKKSRRKTGLTKALRALIPGAPFADFHKILEIAAAGHLRHLPASIAAWQAVTSHVRHCHTDYDQLLEEGYDQSSARHFVVDQMNHQLGKWGCSSRIDQSEPD